MIHLLARPGTPGVRGDDLAAAGRANPLPVRPAFLCFGVPFFGGKSYFVGAS